MTQSNRDLHVALQHGTQQQTLHEPQEASEAQSQVEDPALPDACNAGEAPAAVAQAQAAPPPSAAAAAALASASHPAKQLNVQR